MVCFFFFFTQVEADWTSFPPQLSRFPVFSKCICFPLLKNCRCDQAPALLGSITPSKKPWKEERDASPIKCYGFTISIFSRETADLNLKTSEGSCRITSYFVPMLISHRAKKKPHLFPANFECVGFSFSFWILGSLCSSLESFGALWFLFSFSSGSYTWKWRQRWVYFFLKTIHRCILLPARIFPHPTIIFLALLYTILSFQFQTGDSGLGTLCRYQSLCHT